MGAMASKSQRTLLVAGASGKLDRKVVELLLEAKAGRVIAGSREPEKLANLSAKGAETRRIDFDDPASLKEALAGVERALIISTDAQRRSRAPLPTHSRKTMRSDVNLCATAR
jgi:NAD(P)H dehydrogenase (quinone)